MKKFMVPTLMENKPVKVVVIGGGTAGWLTVQSLKYNFQKQNVPFHITVIESKNIPTVGVGEATADTFVPYLKSIGLDVIHLLENTKSSFKNCILFNDWNHRGSSYWHPFYTKTIPFEMMLDSLSAPINFDELFFNYHLGKQNKSPIMEGREVSYGLHFDNFLLANYLKKVVLGDNVTFINDDVVDFEFSDEHVVKVVCTLEGSRVEVDYVADCTGFSSLLFRKRFNVFFTSASHLLLNDRACTAMIPYESPTSPIEAYTSATALKNGWVWNIPLQHRIGTGYVFSSLYCSEDEAEAEYRDRWNIGKDVATRMVRFQTGYLKQQAMGNCFAIGLSSGFIEPLESTGIYLATCSMARMQKYLNGELTIAKYNQEMTELYAAIIDFIFIHYKFAQRADTPYWRAVNAIPTPPHLEERLQLFRSIRLNEKNHLQAKKLMELCAPWSAIGYLVVLQGLKHLTHKEANHPYGPLLNSFIKASSTDAAKFLSNNEFLSPFRLQELKK